MSSVTRSANIYRAPGRRAPVWTVLFGVLIISSPTIAAMARSAHSDSDYNRLARFNFTGTYRFELRQPLIPRSQDGTRVVAMSAPATQKRVKSLRERHRVPPKVIASAKQRTAPVPRSKEAKKRLTVKAEAVPKTPPEKRQHSLAPAAGETPAKVAINPIASQDIRNDHTGIISKRTNTGVAAREQINLASRSVEATDSPGSIRATAIRETETRKSEAPAPEIDTKPIQRAAIRSAVSQGPLVEANRSGLGAGDLLRKDEPAPVPRTASQSLVGAENKSVITGHAGATKTPRSKGKGPDAEKVAAAYTQDPSSAGAPTATITRFTDATAAPPLPIKYLRPANSQTKSLLRAKRTTPKRNRVVKAAASKPKPKPKTQPSSNWLSSAPRWARGAFKSE